MTNDTDQLQRKRTRKATKLRPEVRFVLAFVLFTLIGALIIAAISARGGFPLLERAYAFAAGKTLTVVGVENRVTANRILVVGCERAGLTIVFGCTGLVELALFCSGVLALPARWRIRLAGLGIGLCGISALNWSRLIMLALVMKFYEPWFPLTHRILMQGFLIALIVPLYVGWAAWAMRDSRNRVSHRQSGTA